MQVGIRPFQANGGGSNQGNMFNPRNMQQLSDVSAMRPGMPQLQQQQARPGNMPPSLQQQQVRPGNMPPSLQQQQVRPGNITPQLQQQQSRSEIMPPTLMQQQVRPGNMPPPLQQQIRSNNITPPLQQQQVLAGNMPPSGNARPDLVQSQEIEFRNNVTPNRNVRPNISGTTSTPPQGAIRTRSPNMGNQPHDINSNIQNNLGLNQLSGMQSQNETLKNENDAFFPIQQQTNRNLNANRYDAGGSGGTRHTRSPNTSPLPRKGPQRPIIMGEPGLLPIQKNKYHVKSSFNTRRTKLSDDESEKQFSEGYNDKGGLKTFKRLTVLNENGEFGEWTGFNWKQKKVAEVIRIAHDKLGRLWYVNKDNELCKMTKRSFKNFGHLGKEELIDIAFDNENKLWAVNLMGELITWNGFSWDKKIQSGFHKLRSIAFDKKGLLWAINRDFEIAVLEEESCWDKKRIPDNIRVYSLDFDDKNKLWVLGSNDQLMLLSGNGWVNFGWIACWKLKDISFKK